MLKIRPQQLKISLPHRAALPPSEFALCLVCVEKGSKNGWGKFAGSETVVKHYRHLGFLIKLQKVLGFSQHQLTTSKQRK
jgi:hypothetical protein